MSMPTEEPHDILQRTRRTFAEPSVTRLLACLLAAYPSCRRGAVVWPAFAALMRNEDILSLLTGGKHRPSRFNVLAGLDICQDAFLPAAVSLPWPFDERVLPRWHREPYAGFRTAAETLLTLMQEVSTATTSCRGFLAEMLTRVYARHRRGDAQEEAAFADALAAARDLLCGLAVDCAADDVAPSPVNVLRRPTERLPMPNVSPANPRGRLSASQIDAYLRCPFSYCFENALNMRRVYDRAEIGPEILGALVHAALERFAAEEYARVSSGGEPRADEDAIADVLLAAYAAATAHYGASPDAVVRAQLERGAARLRRFARVQAFWVRDGWRIAAEPEYAFNLRPFAEEPDVDYPFKGSVDRIDYKEGIGYRLIDYKTWESAADAWSRIADADPAEIAFAARLGLPTYAAADGRAYRLKAVQLPLYGHCLARADPARFAGRIADCCYAVLGGSEADTVVVGSAFEQGAFAPQAGASHPPSLVELTPCALANVRVAIRKIANNVFEPPAPGEKWRRALGRLYPAASDGVRPFVGAVLKLLALAEHPEDRAAWIIVDRLFPVREVVFPDRTSAATVSDALARLLSRQGLDGTLAWIVTRLKASGQPFDARTQGQLERLVALAAFFRAVSPNLPTVRDFCAFVSEAEERKENP